MQDRPKAPSSAGNLLLLTEFVTGAISTSARRTALPTGCEPPWSQSSIVSKHMGVSVVSLNQHKDPEADCFQLSGGALPHVS